MTRGRGGCPIGERPRRIPSVRQAAHNDCAIACLEMVLRYHGRTVSAEDLRKALPIGSGLTNARALLRAARACGLRGRGIWLNPSKVDMLRPGAILHFDRFHFVVFEGTGSRGVDIVDPASGRRRLRMDRFKKSFTGVALSFESPRNFCVSIDRALTTAPAAGSGSKSPSASSSVRNHTPGCPSLKH